MAEFVIRCIECGSEMEEFKHELEYETHVVLITPCDTCIHDALQTQDRVRGYS